MIRHGGALVTGLAAIAPNGADTESFWQAVLNGTSGLRPLSRFDPSPYPVRLAGEVPNFVPTDHVENQIVVQTDRWTHLALTAAARALDDAGLVPEELPEYATAVITASSSGGNEFGQREIEALWSKGSSHVGPYQSIAWFYAATTGQISIRHGFKGPCGVMVAEQAGALDAIAEASRVLGTEAEVAVTGGTEAPIGPYALTCQLASGRLSTSDDPRRAFVPFDAGACGFVPGEGGAILVLESGESARARNARHRYGEIAGHAATFDPRPGSEREPGLRRAIELALTDAGVSPGEVDLVLADGSGVPELDRSEADCISKTFGPYGVPVSVPKTLTGRLYAGGPALDVVVALLAIRDRVLPPTYGVERLAPGCELDLVRQPRAGEVRTVLVLARGFEGFNSALVVRAVPEPWPANGTRQAKEN